MISVKDVMTPKIRTIDVSKTISDAARAMVRWKVGSLIVLDGTKPVGIVTEGDISRLVAKGNRPEGVSLKTMRKRLVTVGPGTRLEDAAKVMASAGIKKLPVVDGDELLGIITQSDIVASSFDLVTSLKEMVLSRYRPPDFEP